MPNTIRMTTLVSAAALALVLAQGTFASDEAGAAEAVPAEPEAPAATEAVPAESSEQTSAPGAEMPSRADVARMQAEERRAAMMAERAKRYEELRTNAADIGLELPETPPWMAPDWAMPPMPEMPAMPTRPGMTPEEMAQMREQRQTMRDQMRGMSPEERRQMHEAHREQARGDMGVQGMDRSENPRWAEIEQRRKEMNERFEQYRRTIDQMSEEQIEAARAVFGQMPPMPERPAMPPRVGPRDYGYGTLPQGGYQGFEGYGYPYNPRGMGVPAMPYQGAPGFEQGPPAPYGSGY